MYIGLSSGLVGYWSFDGKDVVGVTAYDRSGQGNKASATSTGAMPTVAPGRIGQALNFDNVDDNVAAAGAGSINNLSQISVSAWIRPRSFGGTNRGRIVTKCAPTSGDGWCINLDNVENPASLERFVGYDDANLVAISEGNILSLNEWNHVVIIWDGSTSFSNVRFFVNGRSVGVDATESGDASGPRGPDETIPLAVGMDVAGVFGGPFDGLIDDVRVYNRTLTADEVKRLYKIGATTKLGLANNAGLERESFGFRRPRRGERGSTAPTELGGGRAGAYPSLSADCASRSVSTQGTREPQC